MAVAGTDLVAVAGVRAGAGGGAFSSACPFPHGLGCCCGNWPGLLWRRSCLCRSWLWPEQLPRSLGVGGQGDKPAQVPAVVVKTEAAAVAGGVVFGACIRIRWP